MPREPNTNRLQSIPQSAQREQKVCRWYGEFVIGVWVKGYGESVIGIRAPTLLFRFSNGPGVLAKETSNTDPSSLNLKP